METIVSKHGKSSIVSMKGKLDALTCQSVEAVLLSELGEAKEKLVLNFEELSYISSAGLRIILKTAKEAKAAGKRFILCGMKDFIKEIFDVSGFSGILEIVDCAESAAKI